MHNYTTSNPDMRRPDPMAFARHLRQNYMDTPHKAVHADHQRVAGGLDFKAIGDNAKALEYLEKASPRLADGQLFLASLHYRKGDLAKTKQTLTTAIQYSKKQVILYNVYAWILYKEGDRDSAIDQLLRCLKIEKDNESTKDNLQRVQNGKKMNMKRFGMTWYGLQFEKLPASMRQGQQQMMGRKGFRQKRRRR